MGRSSRSRRGDYNKIIGFRRGGGVNGGLLLDVYEYEALLIKVFLLT